MEKIKTFLEDIREAKKGKYKMLSFSQVINKIKSTVNEGEIILNYYFIERKLEITIVSKTKYENGEHKFGVKYEITTMDFALQDELTEEASLGLVKAEAPDLLPYMLKYSFDYLIAIIIPGIIIYLIKVLLEFLTIAILVV